MRNRVEYEKAELKTANCKHATHVFAVRVNRTRGKRISGTASRQKIPPARRRNSSSGGGALGALRRCVVPVYRAQ